MERRSENGVDELRLRVVGMVIGQAITDCQVMRRKVKEYAGHKNRNRDRLSDYKDAYDFIFNGDRLPQFLESYGFKYLEIGYIRRKAKEIIESGKSLRTDMFVGGLRKAA